MNGKSREQKHYLQDNQPVFEGHCGTTRLHERDNMATTTPTTIPTREAEEAMLTGNQKQPTINKSRNNAHELGNQFIVPSSTEALQVKSNGLPKASQDFKN